MDKEKIKTFWKKYSDGTEILVVFGVQIASVQPSEGLGYYEAYIYDSDFEELLKEVSGFDTKDKNTLKLNVENVFLKWVEKCYKSFFV